MGRNHLTASLAAHAVLLVLLYYFGAYQPTIAVQNKQLEASRLMNSHAAMRKRVADMERIKDLMRESMGDANDTTPDNLRFDATTAEAPDDLLKRAETLSRDIDAMNERMRVDEYARATGVDRKEAARQLALDKTAAQDTARKTDDAPAGAEALKPGFEQRTLGTLLAQPQGTKVFVLWDKLVEEVKTTAATTKP